ncbi:hypothetical protein [Ideonella sp.]|uniref:hypothetical protein n=1 Tax=Ideonella sp. TaxID=1929293 RepID=UPI002D7EE619|nr:hypothetical protein [Ideonella sp.]
MLRAVHPDAISDMQMLFECGLHDELVAAGMLVPHRKVEQLPPELPVGWAAWEAEKLPIISYPSEWSDAQLRAAALITLEVLRHALRRGMTLKDASAFNVQFCGPRPVFIDLLSFTRLSDDGRWLGYRQFCEHFLGPLAVHRHVPSSQGLPSTSLDGLPLALASATLPTYTWLKPGLMLHIHLHARAAQRANDATLESSVQPARATSPNREAQFGLRLAESLETAVQALAPRSSATSNWSNYRHDNTYSKADEQSKLAFILAAVERAEPRRSVDLGANDGHYARALTARGVACTAVELDAACADAIYESSLAAPHGLLLNTMRVDLANPTPNHGWAGRERASFAQRLRCDLSLSLALIHHLSISRQVPFEAIAAYLVELAPHAIVEYVPPEDPMARQLLAARTGITTSYLETLSADAFRAAFEPHFESLAHSAPLAGGRIVHHFKRRG